jgi:hypothetical protein
MTVDNAPGNWTTGDVGNTVFLRSKNPNVDINGASCPTAP